MSSLGKAQNRDRKIQRRKKMPVDGRGVFTIQEVQIKRREEIKRRKEEKASLKDE